MMKTEYRDHIAELQNMKPKQPFFFLKPTSSMLLPGEGPCIRPKGVDMHYEVELALVMGKYVKDLEADNVQGALDAIKGKSTFCHHKSSSTAFANSTSASLRRGH